jgi:hypothetical protein
VVEGAVELVEAEARYEHRKRQSQELSSSQRKKKRKRLTREQRLAIAEDVRVGVVPRAGADRA